MRGTRLGVSVLRLQATRDKSLHLWFDVRLCSFKVFIFTILLPVRECWNFLF